MAEKARLAHENSIYARENRFLREIVEYHQLTMQDVVYLDEGMEEVTEVYPISTSPEITKILSNSVSPRSPISPAAAAPMEEYDLPVSPIHPKKKEDSVKDSDDGDQPTPTTVSHEEQKEGTKNAPSLPSSSS